MIRKVAPAGAVLVGLAAAALPGPSQSNHYLETFFRQNIGLSEDQIAALKARLYRAT